MTSDGGALLLPEIIRLYNGYTVHLMAKMLLEYFQDNLYAGHIVAVAPHVNQHRESERFRGFTANEYSFVGKI